MTVATNLRKGWCPGALRPMQSGDGLLVRVRPRAGAFSVAALSRIASAAMRFGSGEIDLTNRGNLQIRGVSDVTFDDTLAALDDAGLLDQSAEAEAVRNVIVDPLSGVDPARTDARSLALMLEDILRGDEKLWSLTGKFGFSFSGNAAPRVGGQVTDIMVAVDDNRFVIWLDGARDVCCEVPHDDVVDAVHRLSLAFVELKENDAGFRRMRDAVSRLGAGTLFAMAALGPTQPSPAVFERAVPVGVLAQKESVFGVGVGLPFGRVTARQLDALCEAAAAANLKTVHTGPERILIFPLQDAKRGTELLCRAESSGLISRSDDLRLAMDVCPGAPACANASTDTRRDAQHFADSFTGSLDGHSLHISGCEKGCARREDASITLVGRCGRYDLITNGSASSSSVDETIDAGDLGAAISRLIVEPMT